MSALQDFIAQNGRFPKVSLVLKPLDPKKQTLEITQFLSYNFDSSILVPVDAFSFSFTNPGGELSILDFVNEGDIALIKAHDETICTGLIDVIEIETTSEGGEVVHLKGRDLLGQLEDQTSINVNNDPIWGGQMTVVQAITQLLSNTRVPGLRLQQVPSGNWLFATEPGETKLTSIHRLLEPLNCLVWSAPDGYLNIGRPNMAQEESGILMLDRASRASNVLAMKATRASTQIPNIVVPIWSGQETVQHRAGKEQGILNPAQGPSRLKKFNHNVPRAVVVSLPTGTDPQSQSDVNQVIVGGANLLQAYAKREIARANLHELIVECQVPGHFNDDMGAFLIDQTYQIEYPRADVSEKMYLFQATYTMDANNGQRTNLMFCRLGCLVADISTKVPTVTTQVVNQ